MHWGSLTTAANSVIWNHYGQTKRSNKWAMNSVNISGKNRQYGSGYVIHVIFATQDLDVATADIDVEHVKQY